MRTGAGTKNVQRGAVNVVKGVPILRENVHVLPRKAKRDVAVKRLGKTFEVELALLPFWEATARNEVVGIDNKTLIVVAKVVTRHINGTLGAFDEPIEVVDRVTAVVVKTRVELPDLVDEGLVIRHSGVRG